MEGLKDGQELIAQGLAEQVDEASSTAAKELQVPLCSCCRSGVCSHRTPGVCMCGRERWRGSVGGMPDLRDVAGKSEKKKHLAIDKLKIQYFYDFYAGKSIDVIFRFGLQNIVLSND